MSIQTSAAAKGSLAYDPRDGSTHPPAPLKKPPTPAQTELGAALQFMRVEMVQEFIRRLRRKSSTDRRARAIQSRMKKRKAALAMSAAVMVASPGMVDLDRAGYAISVAPNPFDVRLHPASLSASQQMKEALAEEEGVRLTVYRDVAGYPTVGVGHLVTPRDNLNVGDRITYERALELLEDDLREAEKGVRNLVGDLVLYQNEFDALVDLVYNVGAGNVSDTESPRLNEAVAAGDYRGIADELRYHHAAGEKANGLVFRSERRQSIFMDAAYADPRPSSISVSGSVHS